VPPVSRPFPRFIADAPREKRPYGRWEERLTAAFATACEPLVEEAGAAVDPESIRWFPERAYAGRVFVPVTADGLRADDDEAPVEYFGHVSFERTDDQEEPGKLRGQADFTDVVADDNPDWQVDLNDDVVAKWFAGGSRGGDVTLIWGLPLVRGAVAATAELDGEVVDQVGIDDGRFTLVAVDAVTGFGDDLYLEIVLWDRTLQRVIARESLYAEGGDEAEDASAPEDEAS
jgi:hypothetical protein